MLISALSSPNVKSILKSVQVAEWSYFGKELLFRLTKCFLCKMIIFIIKVGFGDWILVRIVQLSISLLTFNLFI